MLTCLLLFSGNGGQIHWDFWGEEKVQGCGSDCGGHFDGFEDEICGFWLWIWRVEQDRLCEPTVGARVGDACSGFHKPSVMPDYTFEFRYFRDAITV
jgi:hypothetical protein